MAPLMLVIERWFSQPRIDILGDSLLWRSHPEGPWRSLRWEELTGQHWRSLQTEE